MITTWHVPSWCGDYRIEADGDKSLLTVVDPTAAEIDQLARFLEAAKKKGWVGKLAGVSEKGESKLEIAAPIAECGILLLGKGVRVDKGVLTVVASKDGLVSALDGTGSSIIEAVSSGDAKDAVTTKRPTPCCPRPVSGPEKRASDVLRKFCTQRQWESWQRNGFLHCIGNLTGRAYRVAHRRSKVAEAQGRVAWDVYAEVPVHCHASQYPPAEEVLAVKHTLEHREHWLRNRSGILGVGRREKGGRRDLFVNPFMDQRGQRLDGISDASITREIGLFVKEYVPFLSKLRKGLGV